MSRQPTEPLYKELDNFIQKQEFENALTICDKILQISPDDPDAIHCKVVALIHSSKVEDAMKVIKGQPELANERLIFEKAYCLYRSKEFQEALNVLKSHPIPKPTRVLQLEAQVYYRLEDYKKSVQVYEDLIKEHQEMANELKTNLLAAYVSGDMIREGNGLISSNKPSLTENFEFSYNAACIEIDSGDYPSAEKHLNTAEKICRASLAEDGLSEAEIQDELSVIIAQRAYVYQKQGKTNEAIEIYNSVLKAKPSDESVAAVALNNIVTLNKEHDLFDSAKKMKQAASMESKLTSNHKKVIGFNNCLVLLHMNKGEQCREVITSLQQIFPDSDRLALISAALLMKQNKLPQSEELLKNFAEQHPESSLRVQLSIAQLHLQKGNPKAAIAALEAVPSLRTKSGVAATLVSLYEQVNDIDNAMKVFDEYCASLEGLKEKEEDRYVKYLKENANFKLRHRRYREAAATFERIVKINGTDLEAIPGLVMAYSQFDPKMAEKYDAKLPPLAEEGNIDAEALENLAAPRLGKSESAVQEPIIAEVKPETEKKKKKKKKKLPKNFNPNIPPDPERWVPLKQRSTYKKRRKGKIEKGAQGSVPVERRPGYDKSSAPAKEGKQEVPPPTSTAPPKTEAPKPTNKPANNKKKGKNRK